MWSLYELLIHRRQLVGRYRLNLWGRFLQNKHIFGLSEYHYDLREVAELSRHLSLAKMVSYLFSLPVFKDTCGYLQNLHCVDWLSLVSPFCWPSKHVVVLVRLWHSVQRCLWEQIRVIFFKLSMTILCFLGLLGFITVSVLPPGQQTWWQNRHAYKPQQPMLVSPSWLMNWFELQSCIIVISVWNLLLFALVWCWLVSGYDIHAVIHLPWCLIDCSLKSRAVRVPSVSKSL